MSFTDYFSAENRLLICAASAPEIAAVLAGLGQLDETPGNFHALHFEQISILQTGIGKTNAAAALAIELTSAQCSNRRYSAILNVGIAGALSKTLNFGSAVLSDKCVLADEGTPMTITSQTTQPWRSLEEAGFATLSFESNKSEWWHFLEKLSDQVGTIATISTISGNETLAEQYVQRSSAIAEGMEGASLATVSEYFQIDFAELRTISNICGNSNRDENPWDFGTALKRLKQIIALMIA